MDPKLSRQLGALYRKPVHLRARPRPLLLPPQGGLSEILENLGQKNLQQLAHYLSER
jgi:hypothetical protein